VSVLCRGATGDSAEDFLSLNFFAPSVMNKIQRLVLLMQAVIGFALTPAPAQTPTPAESTPAQPTPTPTLGDRFTQVLKDRHVLFRFFAPKANAVDVVIGIKSGPYEIQGTTTTPMTRDAEGLWSVTSGPFEPNLYEYQFNLEGRKDNGPEQRHAQTTAAGRH
jgi:hypothetical protein